METNSHVELTMLRRIFRCRRLYQPPNATQLFNNSINSTSTTFTMHLTGIQTRKNNTVNFVPAPPPMSREKFQTPLFHCFVTLRKITLYKQKTLT